VTALQEESKMKICPFVSHMLGEDMDLVAGDSASESGSKSKSKNVVILGYEDTAEGVAEASPAERKRKSTQNSLPSHVQCLKDSCRFYHSKSDDCQFDMMFTMLKAPKPAPAKTAAANKGTDIKAITKDLDKIWKFHTKSVAEMVSTISDSEKTHKKDLDALEKAVTKSIEDLQNEQANNGSGDGLAGMAGNISKLSERIDEREESFESLTTTMSDMVIRMQDAIAAVDSKSDEVSKGIGVLQTEMPTEEAIKRMINESVNDIDTVDAPDMRETIDEIQKRVDAAMERYMKSVPDLMQREIRKDIESAFERHQDSTPNVDGIVEQATRAHRETDRKITQMYSEISDRMNSLAENQVNWQKSIEDAIDEQTRRSESYRVAQPTEPAEPPKPAEPPALAEPEKAEAPEEPEVPAISKSHQKEAKKLNNLGVASFHNSAFEMARDQFLDAVKVNPEFAEAFNNLGLAYTELQQEDDASRAFQRAIEINADLHAAYNNLGYVLFKQGEYEQAIEMYNEALGRNPDNSSAHTNLGNAYFKLKRYEDAEDAWSKALELDPGNDRARRNLKRIREESK